MRDPGCASCSNRAYCNIDAGRKTGLACLTHGPSEEICARCCLEDVCAFGWRVSGDLHRPGRRC